MPKPKNNLKIPSKEWADKEGSWCCPACGVTVDAFQENSKQVHRQFHMDLYEMAQSLLTGSR